MQVGEVRFCGHPIWGPRRVPPQSFALSPLHFVELEQGCRLLLRSDRDGEEKTPVICEIARRWPARGSK